jgi:[ribosomal protein S18]-alanine N-acetyltransferase
MHVRPANPEDFSAIRRIQSATAEAAQWDCSLYATLVAEKEGTVAGFLVWRETAPDEAEILNLAVDSLFRRQGAGLAMVQAIPQKVIFLEVRESNRAAQNLYRKAGFREVGIRFGYYQNPLEPAIVMRFQS